MQTGESFGGIHAGVSNGKAVDQAFFDDGYCIFFGVATARNFHVVFAVHIGKALRLEIAVAHPYTRGLIGEWLHALCNTRHTHIERRLEANQREENCACPIIHFPKPPDPQCIQG